MNSHVILFQVADASLRGIALAGMAALLALFFRRSAAVQHALWTAVVAGMLTMPLLRMVIPPARVVALPQRPTGAMESAIARRVPSVNVTAMVEPAGRLIPWQAWVTAAYLVGLALFAIRLGWAILVTWRLRRRAHSAGSEGVLESGCVRVPLTMGYWRPRVILPTAWREWSPEIAAAVLTHEQAHVRRRDPLVLLLAAVNKCVFWFHPLAWWIERRLAVLAEHAADDAVLSVSTDAAGYARVLLTVAAGMENRRNRLLLQGAGMDGSRVARRICRLLDPGARKQAGRRAWAVMWAFAAAFLWATVAVDSQTVVRAQGTRPQNPAYDFGFRAVSVRPETTTPEQAAQLEQQLAANPDDENVRARLLHYYYAHNEEEDRVRLIYWLIDHHPESPLHGYDTAGIFPHGPHGDLGRFEQARQRWWVQVGRYPSDPNVLVNAARAQGDRRAEINLRKRARNLDSSRLEGLARVYALELVFSTSRRERLPDPTLAPEIRRELREVNDIALVGTVARYVVEHATRNSLVNSGAEWDFAALKGLAAELVFHAMSLEPQNREWSDLMTGVALLPSTQGQHSTRRGD